jgi:hypothetical protein
MTIEQTVEIPADHKLALEVQLPEEIPTGKARIALVVFPNTTPEYAEPDDPYAWRKLRGKYKGERFSSEELFKERSRDLLREEAKIFGKISPEAIASAAKCGVTPVELGLEKYI